MQKYLKALESRTVLTVLAAFIVHGLQGIYGFIPADLLPLVDAGLTVLAIYFRVNPKQSF